MPESALLLAIDTCGPSGSVALGRLAAGAVEILGQKELAGRTYSATLVAAIGEMLTGANLSLGQLGVLIVVNGPGSFTGVRVGVSAAKGLAEGASLPALAVSRLEVLAFKARAACAALDAQRGEIFLRIAGTGRESRELLAGAGELAQIGGRPAQIAICDDAAAALLGSAWPAAELLRVSPPAAADALQLCASRAEAREFADLALADLALLDGHYLRRSDAEIFGEPAARSPSA